VSVREYRGPGSRQRALQSVIGSLRESVDVLVPGRLSADPHVLDANVQLGAVMAARGIRMRALYSAAVLGDPDCDRFLRRVAEVGVEIRVIDSIVRTFNDVMIFDRATVFLSGYPGRSLADGEPGPDEPVIRIGGSLLAPSFQAMFEAYWRRASPYAARAGARPPSGGPELPELPELTAFEQTVVRLMSHGHDDRWIARELGVGTGAVADVMQALMRRLGAANRFEAGFRLAAGQDPTGLS
jgi:DNA-binding CsgD family transcriptional regulator